MSFRRTLISRLLQAVPVLWSAATLVWIFLLIIPGDPARAIAGPRAGPEAVAAVRKDLGLDRPPLAAYLSYLGRLARGDLGRSYVRQRRSVVRLLGDALVKTIFLGAAAMVLALLAGIPLGVTAAKRRGLFDAALTAGTVAGISMPSFWVGLLLMLVFASRLRWLPVSGYGEGIVILGIKTPGLSHLILPAVTLAVFPAALIARVTRAAVLEQMSSAHVLAARARGLPRSLVVWRHAFRNALGPVVTVGGMLLATLFGGAIATEIVYSWPGLGLLLFSSLSDRDLMVVEGAVLLLTAIFVAANLAVDLAYAVIDPRTRGTES